MFEWVSLFPGSQTVLKLTKKAVAMALQTGPVPQHVGFVMDGNRRYAKTHNIELKEGHNAGFESMAQILELCYEAGVHSATVFAFSIDNFKRSKREIDWLMELAKQRFTQMIAHGELAEKYGVRIRILGDRSLLPADVLKVLEEAEQVTRQNKRAVLNVCFPYTSRHEMAHAMKHIVKHNLKQPLEIDEETMEKYLYTGGQPPLELLVRTSGVYRLSDFLLWQVSNKGVMMEFVETLWPDFTPLHMVWILIKYSFKKSYHTQDKKVV
jgi:ditrans,polycis-polyprenyl diphosphate synthase